ncbi:hypothetical protein E4U43_005788 [Claviceps pusilla]|uniref:Alb1-domain-containing protein n=1 Tax=Claviceps pusilla TaxID=123648 RepID=A0A9P7N1N3_9HYPO|nr:hypothetical protein E4U43_005788 [Claviceps pusilla]
MAKTKAPPSKHSRAARRATSPSINTDKSLKELAPPARSTPRPSVLDVHRSAGVSKKTRPVRKSRLSSKMRRRHERGLEMAAAVTERTGKKLEKSIGRARVVVERSRAWEEVNRKVGKAGGFGALMDEGDEQGWNTDEEEEEVVKEVVGEKEGPTAGKSEVVVDEDEDVIL